MNGHWAVRQFIMVGNVDDKNPKDNNGWTQTISELGKNERRSILAYLPNNIERRSYLRSQKLNSRSSSKRAAFAVYFSAH